ncbi:hypothetical protein GF406_14275 [candidate division KSB1 bacterium]|nr:hypothetical protein [candidate division KSB1 bacterium]
MGCKMGRRLNLTRMVTSMAKFENKIGHLSRDPAWWTLTLINLAAWLLYWLFSLVVFYPFDRMTGQQHVGLLITYVTGYIISLGLLAFYQKTVLVRRSFTKIMTTLFFFSIGAAIIWLLLDDVLTTFLYRAEFRLNLPVLFGDRRAFCIRTFRYAVILLLWGGGLLLFKFYRQGDLQRLRVERARYYMQTTQLKMLRYQLTPHFMFNSLNSIRTLVRKNPDLATEMISELAEFLKYTLTNQKENWVPLECEIEIIRHYLRLEKIRFADKLLTEIDMHPDTRDKRVPILLLHPLVENAVKYGMQTSRMPLIIQLYSKMTGQNDLVIDVINSGSWVPPQDGLNPASTGTGLENVRQRLENVYTDNHKLEIVTSEKDRVFVRIVIFNAGTHHEMDCRYR